jgi:ubiquinone/menaquinone biosynthesis C-methylase UbiE
MSTKKERYIPALSFRLLTPLYDPIMKWGMREERFKQRLIEQAQILPGFRLLDLGCGTGTLTLMIKQAYPQAEVTGLDGDREVLALAQEKAERAGLHITWDHGLAWEMPYLEKSFDRVVSSLVLHHLTTANKRQAFLEVFRILKPGGEFHIVDFGKPHSAPMRMIVLAMRNLEETAENFAGEIPVLLQQAGFFQVAETSYIASIFGPLSLYRAVRPALVSNHEVS